MKKLTFIVLLFFYTGLSVHAQDHTERQILENNLHEFLAGASDNNVEIHDRFWADDLIYTSSNGERVTKQVIMEGLNNSPQGSDPESPQYHAENIQIRLFDDMAVIAFKLVSISNQSGFEERLEFYNTGTFQKRDGQWKAVAWQATRIPEN